MPDNGVGMRVSTEKEEPMRLGMLTGGGDCPGLNAVMRAVVRKGKRSHGATVLGFFDGWKGVCEDDWVDMTIDYMRGTLPRGGTVLGTTRLTPFMLDDGIDQLKATMQRNELDGLVVIGGEGTLSCAHALYRDHGVPVIGVPKTIDNDINATEMTFGFDTAVAIATEAIDRLHTTAESHDRVMVVEVMGRNVGHIATWAGLAGGATVTLIPEEPFDIARVASSLLDRHDANKSNKYASIIVVAEGARPVPGTLEITEPAIDEYGHKRLGGIAHVVAAEIEARTSMETRVTVLGHVQRGGTPTAHDRVLCSRFGVAAVEAAHAEAWGSMVALAAGQIERVPLSDATDALKFVDPQLRSAARTFFPPGLID